MFDHKYVPRLPLNGVALRDLAHALIEARPQEFEYLDLGQLVTNGERHGVDPRAIAIARERLNAAAEKGKPTAIAIVSQLAVAEELS